MYKFVTNSQFITLLFESASPKEAYQLFEENKEFIGQISLPECIEHVYGYDLYFDKSWQQLDHFIPPNLQKNKQIMRDLLDIGYIEACPDEISAEKVYKISFLLVELGMYCIASEFFASAIGAGISGMQEIWDSLKDDDRPNLRSYINKFGPLEANLTFMKGLLKD